MLIWSTNSLPTRMITVNWSKLPLDLLARIVENHLPAVDDVIMFSSVCHSWNRATRACDKSKLRENLSRQMPWLMLPDGNDNEPCNEQMVDEISLNDSDDDEFASRIDDDDDGFQKVLYDDKRGLLNLSNGRNNKLYRLSLPETYGKACWGSRSGWIVTLGLDREMQLFNPLTKSQLPLPSQTTFRYAWKTAQAKTIHALFFSKVVVLPVPQNNNVRWLVVAILSGNSHVGIARPGDASWTHISHGGSCIADVVYCNKMKSLVFIDEVGSLFSYDVHNPKQPKELKVCLKVQGTLFPKQPLFPGLTVYTHIYLVEFGDYLLAIARFKMTNLWDYDHVHVDCHKMDYFRMFRYGFATTGSNWEELKDGIGNVAVFVGGNQTMCIDASVGGCRSNCIYFCDVHRDSYEYVIRIPDRENIVGHSGVFNLTRNKIESIYDWKIRYSAYCASFLFTPSI